MSAATDPDVAALRRGFVDYLRKHFGNRAIVRGSGNRLVAKANPDCAGYDGADWRLYLSIAGDHMKLRLWPADMQRAIPLWDPGMWAVLDSTLEISTQPVRRWTLPLIEELVRTTFAGAAKTTRWQDELTIRPHGPFQGIAVVLHRDRAGEITAVETRHGPQNIAHSDRIRVNVALSGNPEAVRERLIAALTPRRRPPSEFPEGGATENQR